MTSTYCGKNCDDCSYRKELNCNGCKEGAGNEFNGDCDIAECCRQQFLEKCKNCENKIGCEKYNSAGNKAYFRCIKNTTKNTPFVDVEKIEKCRKLVKIIRIIAILTIFRYILQISIEMKNAQGQSEMYYTLFAVSMIASIINGAMLIFMGQESGKLKFAGGCYFIDSLLTVLSLFVKNLNFLLILAIAFFIISFIAMSQEMYGFADAMWGIDEGLSVKWCNIWKIYAICLFFGILAVVVVLYIPILGKIISTASSIGMIGVSTIRFVYIIDTAYAYDTYVRMHE